MFRYIFVVVLLLVAYHANGQQMEGMVMDRDSKNSIPGVTILNKHSGTVVFSDNEGNYVIPAQTGDTIIFRHTAYQPATEIMPYAIASKFKTVIMAPNVYKLKEATITGKTKYQQDSAEMHEVYGHELAKPPVPKPKYLGLGCAGCFGWLADKITGNSKKSKAFKQQFAHDDQAKYIDSRYTPELVTTMTNLKNTDSIAAFMLAYPMAYDFARAASDLEMKAWIRNNYKEFIKMIALKPGN